MLLTLAESIEYFYDSNVIIISMLLLLLLMFLFLMMMMKMIMLLLLMMMMIYRCWGNQTLAEFIYNESKLNVDACD